MSHKLTTRDDYSTAESRKRLVDFVSRTLEARDPSTFTPYKPNEHDDTFWTVDSANDWKVRFLADEPHAFVLRFRYHAEGRNPHESALAAWLAVRLGATVEIVT